MKPLRPEGFGLLWVQLVLLTSTAFLPAGLSGQGVFSIRINEVLARNQLAFAHPDTARFSDWIELYNTANEPVNIGGLLIQEIEDKGGTGTIPNQYQIPADTVMGAHEYLILWCDNDTNAAGIHTQFNIADSGTALTLMMEDGTPIDCVSFGLQVRDLSIGRVPDGAGDFICPEGPPTWTLNIPTPLAPNVAYPQLGPVESLKINEWLAVPSTNLTKDDWIEVYNSSTNPVMLTGLVITDSRPETQPSSECYLRVPCRFHAATNLSFLGAEDYKRFWCDDTKAPTDHLNFDLSSTLGEPNIRIYYPDRLNFFEQISFPGNSTPGHAGYWSVNGDWSYGRLPDGGPIYGEKFLRPTPDESNFQLMTNVMVNEVMIHTDPPLEDAIELYNPTEQEIDISWWWMSDEKNTPKKFRIPPETKIPPLGYKVIYEMLGETNDPEGIRRGFNTHGGALPEDFAFSSAHGDEVWLFSALDDEEGTLTGLRGSLRFDAIDNGVSQGPVRNSVGEVAVVPLLCHTFGVSNPSSVENFRQGNGAPNCGPRFGPLIVSEVYYHPPDYYQGTNILDNDFDEFVEIYNMSTGAVKMYDAMVYPHADGRTNGWRIRGVVDFNFPTNHPVTGERFELQPGQFVILVNFGLTNIGTLRDFRAKFNIPEHILIFGPYGEKLQNDQGVVEIKKPDVPQSVAPEVGFVPYVLRERVEYDDDIPWLIGADGHTNDVIGFTWFPYIGYSVQRLIPEDYGDEPGNWTTANPTPGRQPIQIYPMEPLFPNRISFFGWAGSRYTLQRSDTVDGTNWVNAASVAAQSTSGDRTLIDPNFGSGVSRFYRIATP